MHALRFRTAPTMFLVLLATVGVARQASGQVADERFRLDLGGFFQNYDSTLSYASGAEAGTPIDLEKDLGLGDTQTSFRVDGYWRFGPRGRLQFAYAGSNRSGGRVLDRDIVFDDKVYHAGGSVDGRFRFDLAELYYSYSFVHSDAVELGAMLGVSSYFAKVALEGNATVSGGGQTGSGSFSVESKSFVAPIPALGAHLRVTLARGLYANARIRGLRGSVGDYYGSMVDGRVGLDWRFAKNFGVGGAYQYVRISFEREQEDTIKARLAYDGPLGYLSLWF